MKVGIKVDRAKGKQAGSDRLLLLVALIIVTSILTLCLVLSYWVFFFGNIIRSVPISLHSVLISDYQIDTRGFKLPRIRFSIVQEALADQYGRGVSEGQIVLESQVVPPILTSTPRIEQNDGFTPVPTSFAGTGLPTTDIRVPSYTPTPYSSLATNTPRFSSTPTSSVFKSWTPVSTTGIPHTFTPTSWLSTATKISTQSNPTNTPPPSPSNTVPPTPTKVPTRTPSPTLIKSPTYTSPPPTSTPRPTNTPDPYPGPSPNPTSDPYP